MRIALTITELHPGGAETCLVNLAGYLQGRGHQVQVWQLWPDPPSDKRSLTDQLDRWGIEWSSGGAIHARNFPRAAMWLRSELRAFQPDVVQAFLFHANLATAYAVGGLGAAFFGGVRVRQPQRIRWWLQRQASRRMHKLICVSHMVAEHCREVEGIPPGLIEVIPNGIDIRQEFREVSWGQLQLPRENPVILFVGRLDEQKGIEEFLQRADRLLVALPTHQIVLMGDGPLKTRLRHIKDQLSNSDRVHLVGWHPRAIDWMRIAQMLVLPAKYEGMPNVILEAMLAGIPAVTFNVDGVEELLNKSREQVVQPGNYDALMAAIVRLGTDAELREQCAQSNLNRVRQEFDLDLQLSHYEALYIQAAHAIQAGREANGNQPCL